MLFVLPLLRCCQLSLARMSWGVSGPSFPPLVPKGASLIGQDLGRDRGVPTSGSKSLIIDGNEDVKAGPGQSGGCRPGTLVFSGLPPGNRACGPVPAGDSGTRTTWNLWRVFLFFLPHSDHPSSVETVIGHWSSVIGRAEPPADSPDVAWQWNTDQEQGGSGGNRPSQESG